MMASITADRSSEPVAPGPPDLAALYQAEYRSLVRLASLLIDDVGTCEEIVQDAFVKVWAGAGRSLRDPDRMPAYLRSAVLNGARSQLRRRLVRRRHLAAVSPPASAPDAAAEADLPTAEVLSALRALPARQREVLVLRYYLDLTEADIAATLAISRGSVKTHGHRGLAALAQRLEAQR